MSDFDADWFRMLSAKLRTSTSGRLRSVKSCAIEMKSSPVVNNKWSIVELSNSKISSAGRTRNVVSPISSSVNPREEPLHSPTELELETNIRQVNGVQEADP